MIRTAAVLFALFTAVTASAQRPLFDPDDFLDPRATGGRPVFISRLVLGAANDMSGDGFRPLGEHVGYLHLANSFSWRSVQFDYKRSQMKEEDGAAALWEVRTFYSNDGLYQSPAQQTRYATPKSKDTLHAAWYWPVAGGGRGIPVMLRSRLTLSSQPIETDVTTFSPSFNNNTASQRVSNDVSPQVVIISGASTQHMSGRERTFALDTDTWFRIAGHDVFGSLAVSETKTTGTRADRKERALTYTNRFPSFALNKAKIVIRPTLTVGGISNRGGSAVNLVNPAIEIFRPFPGGTNLHVIYSPQWIANGERWKPTHQVALLFDHALLVKVF